MEVSRVVMTARQLVFLVAAAIWLLAAREKGDDCRWKRNDEQWKWYVTNNPTTPEYDKADTRKSFVHQPGQVFAQVSQRRNGGNKRRQRLDRVQSGTGTQAQANWIDVTGGNTILPMRPVLGIALDPTVAAANLP